MTRYIDADALLSRLPDDLPYKASVKRVLIQSPTADVVPRSEIMSIVGAYYDKCDECRTKCANSIAREIFEEIEKIRAKEIHKCETLRDREKDLTEKKYWEGGEHSLRQLTYWLAELKKKYTEEKK